MVWSSNGDTNFFDIVNGVLKEATYQFLIC